MYVAIALSSATDVLYNVNVAPGSAVVLSSFTFLSTPSNSNVYTITVSSFLSVSVPGLCVYSSSTLFSPTTLIASAVTFAGYVTSTARSAADLSANPKIYSSLKSIVSDLFPSPYESSYSVPSVNVAPFTLTVGSAVYSNPFTIVSQ